MNLLGHFACARSLSAAAQAGSALGDLLPLYRRRVRPLSLLERWARDPRRGGMIDEMMDGVRYHLLVDSHFHKDPLFLDSSAAIQHALRAASGAPGLKRFFPAHILTEMFLDHLLMRGDPGLLEAFYDLFGREMREAMARFAGPHPETDLREFAAFLERFTEERFLDDYRDIDGILFRMQRMLRRFGQRALEPAEESAIRAVFASTADRLRGRLLQFVAAMRHAAWARQGAGPAIVTADTPRSRPGARRDP